MIASHATSSRRRSGLGGGAVDQLVKTLAAREPSVKPATTLAEKNARDTATPAPPR